MKDRVNHSSSAQYRSIVCLFILSLILSSCSWSPRLRRELMSDQNNRGYTDLTREMAVGYALLGALPSESSGKEQAYLPFAWGAVSDAYGGFYGQGYQFQREPLFTGTIPGYEACVKGLLRGDYIVEFDGKKVSSGTRIWEALRAMKGQKTVKIKFDREGAVTEYEVPVLYLRSDVYFGIDSNIKVPYSDLDPKKNMIMVSQRLIELTQNDDELAYILAHDIAHKILGHTRPEGYNGGQFVADTIVYGMLAAAILPLHESGSYTKEAEAAAYDQARLFMISAGYDPERGFKVVERLKQMTGGEADLWFFIHPVLSDTKEQYKTYRGQSPGVLNGN